MGASSSSPSSSSTPAAAITVGSLQALGPCCGGRGRTRGAQGPRTAPPPPPQAPAWCGAAPGVTRFGAGGLVGQDKWLGGELGDDGCIYGCPGNAESVLKIDPNTGAVSTFGGPLPGKYKWLRGLRAGDGSIYCVPSWATSVLRITPSTGACALLGEGLPCLANEAAAQDGRWKWHGGVLANDGCIYGIPCNAETVLKVDPSTGEISTFGGPFVGKQKWYGGLLGAADGCIYGCPCNADGVLKIDPVAKTATVIGTGLFGEGGMKWHGGVVGGDGAIYALPNNTDTVLKIVPGTGECTLLGGGLRGGKRRVGGRYEDKYKYQGGVLGNDGNVYAMPADADRVLRIVCATGEVGEIGRSFEDLDRCFNKWQNGFVGRDGCVGGAGGWREGGREGGMLVFTVY